MVDKIAVFWRLTGDRKKSNQWNIEIFDGASIDPQDLRERLFAVYVGAVGVTIEFKLKAIMVPNEDEIGILIDL